MSVSAQAPPNPDLERARLEATDAFAELASMSSKQSRNRKQQVRCSALRQWGRLLPCRFIRKGTPELHSCTTAAGLQHARLRLQWHAHQYLGSVRFSIMEPQ